MQLKAVLVVICAVLVEACSSAVATGDRGVREIGRHTRLYEGAELEVVLAAGYAAGHVGEEYMLLGASLAGVSGNRFVEVDRTRISLRTPDGRAIPLMSQAAFREGYAELESAARLAETFSPTVLDSTPTRRPCNEWFFRAPSDGLTRDVLTISSTQVCHGILFFHVPGGVRPGSWELEIGLEEVVVGIPFVLE